MWPFSLDPCSQSASHVEQQAQMSAGGHGAGADTSRMFGNRVPAPLTPDHLLPSAATGMTNNQNPPGVSVYRHHPPEAWSPIERFLHAPEDEDHVHKRARLQATGSVAAASSCPGAYV